MCLQILNFNNLMMLQDRTVVNMQKLLNSTERFMQSKEFYIQ